jgi:hypothetical protein
MKTLDDVIIELSGVLPDYTTEKYVIAKDALYVPFVKESVICTRERFQQRAKELGFVGRYRWGVEYKTDGKRPDLADDVVVCIESGSMHDSIDGWKWPLIGSFRIVDDRYKPQDTSYLDKSDSSTHSAGSSTDNGADWYDYDNQKALRLPPVGAECEISYTTNEYWHKCIYRGETRIGTHIVEWLGGGVDSFGGLAIFRPLDHDRKAKAKSERKRVVDAAYDEAIKAGCVDFGQWLSHLYDKGFLKLPD